MKNKNKRRSRYMNHVNEKKGKKEKIKISRKQIMIALLIIALSFAGILGYVWLKPNPLAKTVMKYDEESMRAIEPNALAGAKDDYFIVSGEELQLIMQNVESDTISHFYKTYNVERGDNQVQEYWNKKFGDSQETPIQYLRRTAIERAKKIKTIQIMLRARGLLGESMSFSTFKKDFEKEKIERLNEERKFAGVKTINMSGYYFEVNDKYTDKLFESLRATGELTVSEEESRSFYDENRAKGGFKNRDFYKFQAVRLISDRTGPESEEYDFEGNQSEIFDSLNKIYAEIKAGGDSNEVCEKYNKPGKYKFRYLDYNFDSPELIDNSLMDYNEYKSILINLEPGKLYEAAKYEAENGINPGTGPIDVYAVFHYESKIDNGYSTYEENQEMIEYQIAKNKFDPYISEKAAAYHVEIDDKAVENIKVWENGNY